MEYIGKKVCAITGIPFAHGQTEKGVEEAPQHLRDGGLFDLIKSCGWEIEDEGDLKFDNVAASDPDLSKQKNIKSINSVGDCCRIIFEHTKRLAAQKKFVLNLGGDHGVAGATVAGMLAQYPNLAVLWIDAHGDCNTPTSSPSANYHGMPVAHLLGWFGHDGSLCPEFDWDKAYPILPEERLALVGLRDVDNEERILLQKSKIHCFSMQDVDRRGIGKVIRDALHLVDPDGNRPLHLSFDIDACDPSIAPGTGTCARGGLSYREAHFIVEAVHATGHLVSMDLVEVNPRTDVADELCHGDRIKQAATKTVRLGVDLIGSAMGTSIL